MLNANQLHELDNFFMLKTIIGYVEGFQESILIAIFGHALGGDLAARIIGPKFHGIWTNDAVTGYLSCRFKWTDRNRDTAPTLLDYERYVPDYPWMHAPKRDHRDRLDPKRIKQMINAYDENNLIKTDTSSPTRGFPFKREPCNLD